MTSLNPRMLRKADLCCQRCGKKHLSAFVWLELNTHTGRYTDPDKVSVPTGESQGLFPFGKICAARTIKADLTAARELPSPGLITDPRR